MGLEVWGDESGNEDFGDDGTKYFIVATIVTSDVALADDLLALRRTPSLQGYELHEGFHATEDAQAVRNQVFGLLAQRAIRFDATIYTKARVYERIKQDKDYFYKWAWYYHLRHVLPLVVPRDASPLIVMATQGTKKRRERLAAAVRDVVNQCLLGDSIRTLYWSSASHPCLQVVDYYAWAIGRLREKNDPRAFEAIKHQAGSVYTFI